MIRARLTLVSASPRRAELLQRLGVPFDVRPSHASESWHGADLVKIAQTNALRKVKRSPDYGDRFRLLLGADTLITVGDQVLGKPIGPDSAARMLGLLSGRSHTVVTGVCLAGVGQNAEEYFEQCGHAESRVKIGGLSPAQVRAYIHSGEWSGKAGGYAIQGLAGTFASCVSGELDNVIGLPLRIIHEIIRDRYGHIELF